MTDTGGRTDGGMTALDDVRRQLAALDPAELRAIGRNREAVERAMVRAVDDLGWSGAAALLRSVAARMEAREDADAARFLTALNGRRAVK